MACREQILSENYGEALVDYLVKEDELNGMDYCIERIDDQFAVMYFRCSGQFPISVSRYTYNSIPKLYGLMQDAVTPGVEYDPINLIRSGISQVQRPPLSLTGKGVVIGFIDTGEPVMLLSLTVNGILYCPQDCTSFCCAILRVFCVE